MQTPSTEQGQGSIKGDDPSKIFDDHGINELGQLLKQKTFTRQVFPERILVNRM